MSTVSEAHQAVQLADMETRLSRVESLQRQEVAVLKAQTEFIVGALDALKERIADLERIWEIARQNPELVRELAAQALKGRKRG